MCLRISRGSRLVRRRERVSKERDDEECNGRYEEVVSEMIAANTSVIR
jgi:hypothetical protein